MKKRTLIALYIHIVLAIALSIYVIFFHVDSSVKELMESDIRIVIDSQEEFDEAIKTDGRIYALGEMRGTINVSDIFLDGLVYRGNDKWIKEREIKSHLEGDYVYIDFFSEILFEKTIKKEDPFRRGEYLFVTQIEGEPYAYLDFYDTFSFYGHEFPNSKRLMHSVYNYMKSIRIDGKANEHVVSATYIPDKQPMWLDFTVTNGQIDIDSVEIHRTNSSFDYTAREASGYNSTLYVVGGVFLLAAIFFGVTVGIMTKIDQIKRKLEEKYQCTNCK